MELKVLKEKWDEARAQAQSIIRDHETKAMDPGTRERLRKFLDDAEGYKEQFELKQRDEALTKFERSPQDAHNPLMDLTHDADGSVTRLEGIFSEPEGRVQVERKAGALYVSSEVSTHLTPNARKAIYQPEYTRAFRRFLASHGKLEELDQADRKLLVEAKAAQEGLDPYGGYLTPEDLVNRMVTRTPAPMRLRGKCQSIPTSRDSVVMPKSNYLAENDTPANVYDSPVRVTWTGETPASSTTSRTNDNPFGTTRIPVYTAMISLTVTADMIEDGAIPIVSFISQKFSNAVDILYDNMILNGSGISQPRGILSNPDSSNARPDKDPATVPSKSAAALTWGGLQDLAYALPEQYDDGATMVFNKQSTARAIAGLVDGQNRPFWGMGYEDSGFSQRALGRPLLGYETTLSALVPNVGANNYPIVLGNFGGYYLVERVGFTIRQLTELYAETNMVVILGRLRFGGEIAEPWRFKIQQCHT